MKINLISIFFVVFISCVSNQSDLDLESDNITTRSNCNMPESYFVVDSGLAVGIGERINRFTATSTRYVQQVKVIKNVISYGGTRSSSPSMFIENYQEGGFSIISADKRIRPILAYSNEGEFSLVDVPSVVLEWMKSVSDVIADFRENNLQPDPEVTSMWNSAECPEKPIKSLNCDDPDYTSEIRKGPYLKSEWNQQYPYNKYCPNQYPVGCAAVAIGQIMRYWEYPRIFNWNNMPYNSGTDDTAHLLAEIGDSNHLKLKYTSSGSTVRDHRIDNVLRMYGYNSTTREKYNYEDLVAELYAGRPVILEGKNQVSSGAHSWVCDGIQIFNHVTYSSSLLHMNWGFSKTYYNGYYQVSNWSYTDPNTGKVIFDYEPNFTHRMVLKIRPQ